MSAAGAGLLSARTIGQASKSAAKSSRSLVKNPSWGLWQAVAIRSGTMGAIAAGGVAAYMNREHIIRGAKSMKNIKLSRESLKEGYNQSYDALGQGLAYINRDAMGQSFAWLSSHLKFVGALMQQKQMNLRLERLAGLEGIGVKNIYTSMGENGYWSGGYFVPERTFCAVPSTGQKGDGMFIRNVNTIAADEIRAHMSMFKPDDNSGYEDLSNKAKELIIEWFNDESELVDTAPFQISSEEKQTVTTAEGDEIPQISEKEMIDLVTAEDESPLDIVAVAAAVPLPDDDDNRVEEATERQTYLRSLLRIANNAGTGLRSIMGKKRGPPSVTDEIEGDTVTDSLLNYLPEASETVLETRLGSERTEVGLEERASVKEALPVTMEGVVDESEISITAEPLTAATSMVGVEKEMEK